MLVDTGSWTTPRRRFGGPEYQRREMYMKIGAAKKIDEYVKRSLMLVTALAPVIGYDKASKIAHYAMDHDLTLKDAALKLGFVSEEEFDRVVDPAKMVRPYVAAEAAK